MTQEGLDFQKSETRSPPQYFTVLWRSEHALFPPSAEMSLLTPHSIFLHPFLKMSVSQHQSDGSLNTVMSHFNKSRRAV